VRGSERRAARICAVGLLVASGLAACGSGAVRPSAAKASQTVGLSPSGSGAAATGSAGGTAADQAARFRSPRRHPEVAEPVRLRIPAIGVDTPLERLGLEAGGAIEAPRQWQEAGWYTGSVRPGLPGPAVILGHVDSRSGPAVFYHLDSVLPGDAVQLTRADGTRVVFRVSGRQQVAKSRFPTDLVYGPTLEPSLRLVTCGGTFDSRTGHYRDNIIVSAVLS
jgi:sortase (surface protein transpeptidase)